jgi:5-oxoprolinase (ATP-hydrolysing) subunit A
VIIDLNADLAEGYGDWRMGDDEALLDVLSSANLACGFHAGDPTIMHRTIHRARERGVDIGAHVGFPDKQGFGRRVIPFNAEELAALTIYQLGALDGLARAAGTRVTHMSFHGALGNLAARDLAFAEPLLAAVAAFDRSLIVLSSSSEAMERTAAKLGLTIVTSFLADRAYDARGLLVPRGVAGAVIHDQKDVLARVRRLLTEGSVVTHDGAVIPMPVRSILVHGDTPGAVSLARAIRAEVEGAGHAVVPLSRPSA